MSQNYEGVVRSTLERNYRGKKLYSFFLDGVDGLFKLGEKRPTFKEGAYVKFTVNDKLEVQGDVAAQSKEPVESQAKTVETAKQAEKVEKAVKSYEDKDARREAWEHQKQKSIHWQNARGNAIEVVIAALEQGVISLGSKKNEQFDNFLGYVDQLTTRYFKDNEASGHVVEEADTSLPQQNSVQEDDGE